MKAIYKSILVLSIAGVSVLFSSCGKKNAEDSPVQDEASTEAPTLTAAQLKRAEIQFGKIEMKNLSSTISVNGILDVPPQNLVTVSAIMGGFIKTTHIIQGMKVKKGEVLAVIQNPDFIKVQREYLENKQKLKFLEQEYKRQEELSRENVASTKTFQQVSADYNSMLAANGALEEELRMLNISPSTLTQNNISSSVNINSPIDGYVTTVNVNIGKYVNPQDVIFEIVDTKHLHVELTVFEKDITKVKIGQKIRYVLVNESNVERTGTIYLVNHKIQEDRTVRVHAHMDKEDQGLLPNMYLKAVIETGNQQVTALPDQAIVTNAGKYFIYVSTDKVGEIPKDSTYSFKAIEIQKGVSENGYTEVLLPDGFDVTNSSVVTKGAFSILAKLNNKEEEE
jgi:cobalt-zinc-cadmium efflux system membrane fusion protein